MITHTHTLMNNQSKETTCAQYLMSPRSDLWFARLQRSSLQSSNTFLRNLLSVRACGQR